MASKVLASLLFAACVIAAPTEKCIGVRAKPVPAGATCQNTQALAKPLGTALISNKIIASSIAHPYARCGDLCAKTSGCLSFAYVNSNRACRLYKQTLSTIGLKPSTSQPDIRKDDLACYTRQCTPIAPTCTTSTASATLTALATPTTILAADPAGVDYNIDNQQVSLPWDFLLYGNTINSFSMNGFGQLTTPMPNFAILTTHAGNSPYLPQGPSDGGFFSEIIGEDGQRRFNLQWRTTDYKGLQQNPVLVYNWFATFFEAEPARVDFNYVSIPADSKPYPAISYSVYEGNSRVSLEQAYYTVADGEDLTNKYLTYDPASNTLGPVTTVGPDGCVPADASGGTTS